MKPRRRAREVAFQFLYSLDSNAPKDLETGTRKMEAHLAHFDVPEDALVFARNLIAGVIDNLTKIDAQIEQVSSHWRVERMNPVDRNLIRIALFEMLMGPQTHPSVAIDEALELAKQFGTEESPSFVHGILDAAVAATSLKI